MGIRRLCKLLRQHRQWRIEASLWSGAAGPTDGHPNCVGAGLLGWSSGSCGVSPRGSAVLTPRETPGSESVIAPRRGRNSQIPNMDVGGDAEVTDPRGVGGLVGQTVPCRGSTVHCPSATGLKTSWPRDHFKWDEGGYIKGPESQCRPQQGQLSAQRAVPPSYWCRDAARSLYVHCPEPGSVRGPHQKEASGTCPATEHYSGRACPGSLDVGGGEGVAWTGSHIRVTIFPHSA